MNVQRDPDAVLASWLEEGPNRLPEQTRRAISFTTRTTEQKRRSPWAPWRTTHMTIFARVAVAAIAVIAVVGGTVYFMGSKQGVGGAPTTSSPGITSAPASAPASASPSPEADATVPIDWTTYTSSRFAYTVDYPAAWGVTPATQDWPSIGLPDNGGAGQDNFGPKPFGIQLWVSSVALEPGADGTDWITAIDGGNQAFCNQTSNRHNITVDGATWRQEDLVCGQSHNVIEVVGVGRGRFYKINLEKSTSALTATDRATFDRFLASFRFGK